MSMARYVPAVRGWIALLVPVLGGFLLLLLPLRRTPNQAASGNGADNRRSALQERVEMRTAEDRGKYTPEQLREAEDLYQVANQKWRSAEASESLKKMIRKYPDINRTGCATLYLAQYSQGKERAEYLENCIEKFNDCMYWDGVQVGAFARFLLAEDYRSRGEGKKAEALFDEIKAKYSDAVDHDGKLLVDDIKLDSK
jgi:hypothetical protein